MLPPGGHPKKRRRRVNHDLETLEHDAAVLEQNVAHKTAELQRLTAELQEMREQIDWLRKAPEGGQRKRSKYCKHEGCVKYSQLRGEYRDNDVHYTHHDPC